MTYGRLSIGITGNTTCLISLPLEGPGQGCPDPLLLAIPT